MAKAQRQHILNDCTLSVNKLTNSNQTGKLSVVCYKKNTVQGKDQIFIAENKSDRKKYNYSVDGFKLIFNCWNYTSLKDITHFDNVFFFLEGHVEQEFKST